MEHLSKHQQKEIDLDKRMKRLKIFPKDIVESFTRSSGPGGQNVNKVSTCVVLKHIPTGVQVKCQEERSQHLNRYHAKFLLVQKIDHMIHEEHLKEQHEREKELRKNRLKSDSLKEKILEAKHKKSDKKIARKKIKVIDPNDL